MWNLSLSSACHCSARWGGQRTAKRRISPRSSSSRAIRQALDRLADADVVGDQEPDRVELQGHQERHELVGAGLDRDLAERAERAGTGAKSQANRVPEQPAGLMVAQIAGSGGGKSADWIFSSSGSIPATSTSVPPSGRTTRKSSLRLGQDDPLAVPRLDQRSDGVFHSVSTPLGQSTFVTGHRVSRSGSPEACRRGPGDRRRSRPSPPCGRTGSTDEPAALPSSS